MKLSDFSRKCFHWRTLALLPALLLISGLFLSGWLWSIDSIMADGLMVLSLPGILAELFAGAGLLLRKKAAWCYLLLPAVVIGLAAGFLLLVLYSTSLLIRLKDAFFL